MTTMKEAFELDALAQAEKDWPTVVKLLREKLKKEGRLELYNTMRDVPGWQFQFFILVIRALNQEAD